MKIPFIKSLGYLLLGLAILTGMIACNKYDIKPEQAGGFIKFFATGGLLDEGYDVKPTADGGYIILGTATDPATGLTDMFLVKTDQNGNQESWSPVLIGHEFDDMGRSIQVLNDGYALFGSSDRDGEGNFDFYFVKTDLSGKVAWEKFIGGSNAETGSNMQKTAEGGFVMIGTYQETGYSDALLATLSGNGQEYDSLWVRIPATLETGSYVQELGDNFVILSNVSAPSGIFVNNIPKDLGFNPGKLIQGPSLTGKCLQRISDETLIVSGSRYNSQTRLTEMFLQEIRIEGINVDTGWVQYYSGLGEISDDTGLPEKDEGNFVGMAVRSGANNTLAIAGVKTVSGNEDMVFLLTDQYGNEITRRYFGDNGFQRAESLEYTPADNGFIIVGTNGNGDNGMVALVKTDKEGNL